MNKVRKRKRYKTAFARESAWKAKHTKQPFSSSLERKVEKWLVENNIKYQTQYLMEKRFFDFYLPDQHLLLEIHGDYWHGLDYHKGNKGWFELYAPQRRSIRADKMKIALAKRRGYSLHIIWEHELDGKLRSGRLLEEIRSGSFISSLKVQ